jgi:hypothetical protein
LTERKLINKRGVEEIIYFNEEKMSLKSAQVNPAAWLADSTAWKNFYFEENGVIFISFNPYMLDKRKSHRGTSGSLG